MSRLGKKPIAVPAGIEVKIEGRDMTIKGPKGSLDLKLLPYVKAELKEGEIVFSPLNISKQARANWGTIRSLVNNAIKGLISGFEKNLEIEGVGYRAAMEGEALVLNVGYSHPVKFSPPQGVKIAVAKNVITVAGTSKDLVGRTAAQVRAVKKVEPYKGKGIRYQGEVVRRKVGKKVAGAGEK